MPVLFASVVLQPRKLDLVLAATDIIGVEWTVDVEEYENQSTAPNTFRMDVVEVRNRLAQTNYRAIQNVTKDPTPVDGFGDLDGKYGINRGASFYSSSVYDSSGSLYYHVDGIEVFTDPKVYPYWGRAFDDVDGLAHIGKQVFTRVPGVASPGVGTGIETPFRIRYRTCKVGEMRNPPGNLSRKIDGTWDPLLGDYAVWDDWVEIEGLWTRLSRRYFREDVARHLEITPVHLFSEQQVDSAVGLLSDDPTRIHYSDFRCWDGQDWHEMVLWQVSGNPTTYIADTDYGIGFDNPKRITYSYGHPSDTALERSVGRYFFTNLDYWHGASGDALVKMDYQGDVTVAQSGGINGVGPRWRDGSSNPAIQQEKNRGFYVILAAARDSVFRYVAPRSTTYRVVGDHAQWNVTVHPTNLIGSGSKLTIERRRGNDVYYDADLSPLWGTSAAVDPDNPFAASNVTQAHFDVEMDLEEDDELLFRFHNPSGLPNFGETAFRVNIRHRGGYEP